MAKPKLKNRSTAEAAAQQARGISKTVTDSAQQIWLAGLGAFVKAQAEGGKLFESLVKEGAALDSKTRKFTDSKVARFASAARKPGTSSRRCSRIACRVHSAASAFRDKTRCASSPRVSKSFRAKCAN
jgi:poly(hydroxyalkanoate) granule-associated protein